MSGEIIDTVVVGGGQAGLALSYHLSERQVPHLILERHRVAERWRSERWDSLVANGPAWHDRFPGVEYTNIPADAFPTKENVVDYFVAFAEKIMAPVRCGVEVKAVTKNVEEKSNRHHRHEYQICLQDAPSSWQNTLYASPGDRAPKDYSTQAHLV